MSEQIGSGNRRRKAPRRVVKPLRAFERNGTPATGRIVRILFGQGHGFIRLPNANEIYFHRADMPDRAKLSDLRIGDTVIFDLLDDSVSGPRALRVRRPPD